MAKRKKSEGYTLYSRHILVRVIFISIVRFTFISIKKTLRKNPVSNLFNGDLLLRIELFTSYSLDKSCRILSELTFPNPNSTPTRI